MEPLQLGYYEYNYSSGSSPDRKLIFYQKNEMVQVDVEAKFQGEWRKISVLSEDKILCEGESTTDKMKRLIASRALGVSIDFLPEKKFSDLGLEVKKSLINQLEPRGPYRLEIRNNIEQDSRFETVCQIGFFNPT